MPNLSLHIRTRVAQAKAWGYRLLVLPAQRFVSGSKSGGIASGCSGPRLLAGVYDADTFEKLFGRPRIDQIVADAEQILDKQIKIFVDFTVDASPTINWHHDYAAGLDFSRSFYKFSKLRDFKRPDDPKVPWELSRFHHGVTLAMAYVLTQEERYAEGFLKNFEDWLDNNPPGFGVNWTCAMEVAIRACNLIVSFDLLHGSTTVSGRHKYLLEKCLKQHSTYIMQNLEWNERATTNHYISDLVGLIFISALYPEADPTEAVLGFAREELENEIGKQFYEDGGNWESSSTYQRFVVEMLIYALLILERRGMSIKRSLIQKLGRSVVMLNHLSDDGGQIPQIGDNDSGRFLPFVERKDTDVRHIGALFAAATKRRGFLWDNNPCEEVYWVFGEKSVGEIRDSGSAEQGKRGSIAFPDAGWYVMRNGKAQVVASLAPNGQNGSGGHCHNDKLAITVSIGGVPALIDSGTHVYKADVPERFRFRSTSAHNTVVIDGEEQNRFEDGWLFRVHEDAVPMLESWATRPELDRLVCYHTGYRRLPGQITHKRSICFAKTESAWVVVDEILIAKQNEQLKSVEWNWNTPAESLLELGHEPPPRKFDFFGDPMHGIPAERLSNLPGFRIPLGDRTLCVLGRTNEGLELELKESSYSISYRQKQRAMKAVFRAKSRLPLKVHTCFWLE